MSFDSASIISSRAEGSIGWSLLERLSADFKDAEPLAAIDSWDVQGTAELEGSTVLDGKNAYQLLQKEAFGSNFEGTSFLFNYVLLLTSVVILDAYERGQERFLSSRTFKVDEEILDLDGPYRGARTEKRPAGFSLQKFLFELFGLMVPLTLVGSMPQYLPLYWLSATVAVIAFWAVLRKSSSLNNHSCGDESGQKLKRIATDESPRIDTQGRGKSGSSSKMKRVARSRSSSRSGAPKAGAAKTRTSRGDADQGRISAEECTPTFDKQSGGPAPTSSSALTNKSSSASIHYRFVSEYKACMMCATSLMILAVDFPSMFPRRFSKVMHQGYSPMDLGVGSFVFANGLISGSGKQTALLRNMERRTSPTSPWKKRAQTHLPLIILGFGRFFWVWGMAHYVPNEEYGVHWNFFCTLAVVRILGDGWEAFLESVYFLLGMSATALGRADEIIPQEEERATRGGKASRKNVKAVSSVMRFFVQVLPALAVCGGLEMWLNVYGGRAWMLASDDMVPRDTFLTANREGLISCVGFFGLYMAASSIGRQGLENFAFLRCGIASGAIVAFAPETPARRCCDLPYVMHIISCNCVLVAALRARDEIAQEVSSEVSAGTDENSSATASSLDDGAKNGVGNGTRSDHPRKSLASRKPPPSSRRQPLPLVLEGLQGSQLFFFLVANLLTGLVGKLFWTLLMPFWHAVAIMFIYSLTWMTAAYVLATYQIKVKFW
ncbi:unnamed protein product [Amoebophrya sp. A25]|nr:unnamed protein product [Amoebophrya sp. A25]|eukprot:GSA25T00009857001.1